MTEVLKKLELLRKEKYEQLDIKPIVRSNNSIKLKEIRITGAKSSRIFYVLILEPEKEFIILDVVKKKKDRLDSSYFETLEALAASLIE